jgi:hypothetical protein
MTLNVRDAEDSYLLGSAKWQEFINDFNAAWDQPNVDLMLSMLWNKLDDATKAQLRIKFPDQVKILEAQLEVK